MARAPQLLVVVALAVALLTQSGGALALAETSSSGGGKQRIATTLSDARRTGEAAGAPQQQQQPVNTLNLAALLSPRSARLNVAATEAAALASSSASASASASVVAATSAQADDPYLQTVFAAGSAPARRAEDAPLVIPERSSSEQPAARFAATATTATASDAPAASANSRAGAKAEQQEEEEDEPLDLDLARTLASLNTAAYCRDLRAVARWRCGRCQAAAPDFRPSLVHFDASWDLLGLIGYWPARRAIVVAFRGTDSGSLYNWAENMRAWRADARYPAPPPPPDAPPGGGGGGGGGAPAFPPAPDGMRVHSGFLNLWNSSSMAPTFSDAFAALLEANGGLDLGSGKKRGGGVGRAGAGNDNGDNRNENENAKGANGVEAAYVVGHSMGGALAHLCALDLATRFGPELASRTHLYTFGAPRVGNAPFADFSRGRVASYWRFTHARDIVPSVPPQLMGFHHAAREVWLVARDAWPGLGAGQGGGEEEERATGERQQRQAAAAALAPAVGPERQGQQQHHKRRRRLAGLLESGQRLRWWPSWPSWPWPPGPAPPPGPPAPPPPPPPAPPPDPSLPPGAEERAVLCDPSGEDPSCHDSVCYLGLCTSVADHLLYLGRRFYHVDAECRAPTHDLFLFGGGERQGARIVVVGG